MPFRMAADHHGGNIRARVRLSWFATEITYIIILNETLGWGIFSKLRRTYLKIDWPNSIIQFIILRNLTFIDLDR